MALDLKRISALCFDLDGTLNDTDEKWVAHLERILNPFSFLFPDHQAHPFARWVVMGLENPGNLLYTFLDWLNLDDDLARLYNLLIKKRAVFHSSSFLLIPGIKDTLPVLARHYPMAIVSTRDKDSTFRFLDQFTLHPFFQAVATSQTCRHTKPFPDPVNWAAKQLGVQPQSCLMIGDTTVDIKAGKAAGAQTVGVLCGFGTERELRKAGADLILPSPAGLVEILTAGL
jgi:phosphoglycolate phosphatase-like HAD superfamily hydrolase